MLTSNNDDQMCCGSKSSSNAIVSQYYKDTARIFRSIFATGVQCFKPEIII